MKYFAIFFMIILCAGVIAQPKLPKDKFDFPPLAKIQIPKVEIFQLANGMKFFLVEDHDYPTIDMQASIRVGSKYDPKDKIGLASFTADLLRIGGTKDISGNELDKKLEMMAATIECGIGIEQGTLYVSMLQEDLEDVLELTASILMRPTFAKNKLQLLKIQARASISRRNDNVNAIVRREFPKLIYGGESPYARHTEYATIGAIQRKDIVNFYQKYFHPNNIVMAIWGNFKTEKMKKLLKKQFGHWKFQKIDFPVPKQVKYDFRYTVNLVDKKDVNQSSIVLGHIGGLVKNPDYPALSIMNHILSFERMFKKIRTNEGLAYSVWGHYGCQFVHPGTFSVGAQTKSQSTVRAIRLMLKEIKLFMEKGVTKAELEQAKSRYLNSFVFRFRDKSSILRRMMTYAYYGYPLDFSQRIKEKLEKVTCKDVLYVARKYLKPDKVQILVVGNKKYFDEPLKNLGKVNVIDIRISQPKSKKPVATKASLDHARIYIARMAKALGGWKRIQSIKNSQSEMTFMVRGMSIPMRVTLELPNRFRMSLSTPGGLVSFIYNGKEGIIKHGAKIFPMPIRRKLEMLQGMQRDPFFLVKYFHLFRVQVIGRKVFQGKKVFDILVSAKDHHYHLFLDTKSYLPVGTSYPGCTEQGPGEKGSLFCDYKIENAIKIWTKIIGLSGGKKVSTVKFKKIQFNVNIKKAFSLR